ncbi:translation initiation factor 4B [Aspergillus chevalieri]|uniref:RRM domain-containing protein n=1 Tax=Aspergillus chevalieri TaxID=182096 RepID=A0A7R7VTI3_ASPCH|nr:uncharacterized protein ACHE_60358S [Aspergillus chevalieri]BCR90472.1 hypothetical protein ACHE_60358S [Aspergillus chevalieri]
MGPRPTPSASATGFNGYPAERPFATREPLPLPTQPPYTAHIGNLSFDATAADVEDLFAGCDVTNVRIVEDKMTKSPKGFGYVEFDNVDGLKKALDLSGATLQGRSIRVSIAEPPKERDVKEFDWTRKGPLPGPEPTQRRVPDRSTFGRALDNLSDAGSDRPPRRNFESDGKPRDFGNWERKGPLSPVGGAPREGGRRSSPAWGEGRSQEGSRPPRRELQERTPTAAELDNSWRSRMRPDQPSNPPSPAAAPAAPAAPATRPKLNLQKRTVTQEVLSPAASTESKASPFGGAKPIDTATREKQVEERRQISLRQKKEADDKAKAEKAEKQKAAKEQAKAEKPDSNGKDGAEVPQGGKNFDILRRAGEDESGMAADQDPAEEAAKAAAASQEAPAAQSNGNWRSGPAEAEAAGDDEGWSTVSTQKRNNRRGGRALA